MTEQLDDPEPSLVVLSRRGRDSVPAPCLRALESEAHVRVVACERAPDTDTAVRLLADADLLGATNLCLPAVTEPLLARLPRLRGIVLYATGYDHLDVTLLREHGVGLCVLPDYATDAVAEHSVAMLMALATRLHLAHDRSRGLADAATSLRGIELRNKTLGVVGLGRIGSRVAHLGRALGMRVIGTDVDASAVRRAAAGGVRTRELAEVLAESDAVTLCASSPFGARPLIGACQLGQVRTGALLVNVARASLVDTEAAVAALKSGRLRGYAVDDTVLDVGTHADLLSQGRVLQTGHSAWWRDEVLDRGAQMWGGSLLAAVRGRPEHVITWPRRVDLTGLDSRSPAFLETNGGPA